MKITFLGSSHGVPGVERFCSSAAVEVNGNIYLIDVGAPIIDQLMRNGLMQEGPEGKTFDKIKGVFVTHIHGDHLNGLINLLDLGCWYYPELRFPIYLPELRPVEPIKAYLESIRIKLDEDRFTFKLAEEGVVFENEEIKVTYYQCYHLKGNEERGFSYSILVEAEGKRVVFTGDLSHGMRHEDFPKVALEEEVDLVICEMAHFGAEEIIPFMEKCKTKEFWFSHVNRTPVKFPQIAEMDGKFPFPVRNAKDNDTIEL